MFSNSLLNYLINFPIAAIVSTYTCDYPGLLKFIKMIFYTVFSYVPNQGSELLTTG